MSTMFKSAGEQPQDSKSVVESTRDQRVRVGDFAASNLKYAVMVAFGEAGLPTTTSNTQPYETNIETTIDTGHFFTPSPERFTYQTVPTTDTNNPNDASTTAGEISTPELSPELNPADALRQAYAAHDNSAMEQPYA